MTWYKSYVTIDTSASSKHNNQATAPKSRKESMQGNKINQVRDSMATNSNKKAHGLLRT